jgi:hypothetical protein
MVKQACNKAAASESLRRTSEYVEGLRDARRRCRLRFNILLSAEVVEWQTRTFEGRVAKAVRVQVPPSAPSYRCSLASFWVETPGHLDLDFRLFS